MKVFKTIKKRNEILKVKKNPKRLSNRYFNISYEKDDFCYILLVVIKKNFSTSVQRNRIKRQIREILREYHKIYGSLNYRLVFFCKKDLETLSYEMIKDVLFQMFKNLQNNKGIQ